jgi:hypothetical protein
MIEKLTAELFHAFIYGTIAMLGGGVLFEGGKRYAKTAGSTLFKGKVEALPFFFLLLVFGRFLQHLDPAVEALVLSVPPMTRLGIMIAGTMMLFNYSIDYFNYFDSKSAFVYAVGISLIILPSV